MLLAHLRGLLAPDYKYGRYSIFRENIILEALSREKDVEFLLAKLQLEGNFAALLRPADARNLLNNTLNQLPKLRDLSEGNIKKGINSVNYAEVDDFVTLYEALAEAGIVGDFSKKDS